MCHQGGNIKTIACATGFKCTNCTKKSSKRPDAACTGVCVAKKALKPKPPPSPTMCREGGNIRPVACDVGYVCTNCTKAAAASLPDFACIGVCVKEATEPAEQPVGGTGGCFCFALWSPVCVSGNRTLSNSCQAKCQGLPVLYEGECTPVTAGR